MKSTLQALAAASGFLLHGLAGAQAPSTASTIVVTGARIAQAVADSPLDVRVITREQIDRAGSIGLPELLQQLGGVEISATGGAGQPAALFLRGSNSSHVVLLIDGVRVNSATTGTSAFEHLPLAQIERIELLLGPASGLYGADAIGGVVQVFTRRDEGASVRLGAGSERTRSASASLGGRQGDTTASLTLGWRESTPASATNADNAFSFNADADPYRNAHLAALLEHGWARGHTLALRATHADARTHFDAGAGSDDVNRQRLQTLALESRDTLAAGWSSLLRLARGSDALAVSGAFPGRFRTDQDQFTWQHQVAAAGGQFVGGVDWRRENVDSDTAYVEDTRRVGAVFVGWSGAPAAGHGVQVALRHDRDSQFGGHGSGNLGWHWGFAPGWRVSAAAGSAFKAPSFNDLYYPLQWGYGGNPDLEPERSRSLEAGLRHQAGAFTHALTLFQNRIDDLIVINDSFTTVENIASARIRGLTLRAGWTAGAWALRAEATAQDPENAGTGTQLVRRAKRFGSAGLDWRAGALTLGAEWVGVGARYDDTANSAAARLAGYGLVNLSARWRVQPGWTLGARVDNAGDKAYTQVRGYTPPGRRVFLSLAYES